MPRFSYTGRDSDGRTVTGQIDALTIAEAVAQVSALNVELHSIGKVDTSEAGNRITSQSMELTASSLERIDAALSQSANLLPILESAIAESPKSIPVSSCRRLVDALRAGVNANAILKDRWLASYLPLLLRSADLNASNHLTADADAALALRNMSADIGSRRLSFQLFLYPVTLIAITMTLLVMLLVFIVPVFHRMYQEFGLNLPAATQMVCTLSHYTIRHPVRLLGIVTIASSLVVGTIWLWRSYSLTNLLFGSLAAGSSTNLMAMSRFAAALAELLRIGVDLGDAISVAGHVAGNRYFEIISNRLSREIGQSNHIPRDSNYAVFFPASVMHAIHLSSGGESRTQLLRQLSVIYAERVEYRLSFLSSYFGPVTIIVLGGAIGFVIIALFQPLVSLITSLT